MRSSLRMLLKRSVRKMVDAMMQLFMQITESRHAIVYQLLTLTGIKRAQSLLNLQRQLPNHAMFGWVLLWLMNRFRCITIMVLCYRREEQRRDVRETRNNGDLEECSFWTVYVSLCLFRRFLSICGLIIHVVFYIWHWDFRDSLASHDSFFLYIIDCWEVLFHSLFDIDSSLCMIDN